MKLGGHLDDFHSTFLYSASFELPLLVLSFSCDLLLVPHPSKIRVHLSSLTGTTCRTTPVTMLLVLSRALCIHQAVDKVVDAVIWNIS